MKKILAIVLAMLMLLTVVSCGKKEDDANKNDNLTQEEAVYTDASGDEFEYAVNADGNYDITGFKSTNNMPHAITIPSKIDNVEVTGIAPGAFKSNNQISEVTFPDTVTYIDQFAFSYCLYLEKVTMADSVVSINEGAFKGCIMLNDLTLSAGLKTISDFAFGECAAIAEITIPASVEKIGDAAFFLCTSLSDVELSAGLKELGDGAFWGADSLESITIPESVETFGEYVFSVAENEEFKIIAKEGSKAHEYANAYSIAFEKLPETAA